MEDDLIRNRIFKSIHNSDPGAEAYLFGSRARGDFNSKSDWDILILVNEKKITNDIENRFRDNLYEIELETGQIISTFIYPKERWNDASDFFPLFRNIKKEGLKL